MNDATFEDSGPIAAPRLHPLTPMEAWDASHECRHGALPHEPCAPCARTREPVVGYPGVEALARAERAAGAARAGYALPRGGRRDP